MEDLAEHDEVLDCQFLYSSLLEAFLPWHVCYIEDIISFLNNKTHLFWNRIWIELCAMLISSAIRALVVAVGVGFLLRVEPLWLFVPSETAVADRNAYYEPLVHVLGDRLQSICMVYHACPYACCEL